MMNMENDNKIKAVIANHLGLAIDSVKNESQLSGDLGADSLDALNLLQAINETFHVEISSQEMEKIHTVQDLINAVTEKS